MRRGWLRAGDRNHGSVGETDIHILGYFFDHRSARAARRFWRPAPDRIRRARLVGERLASLGAPVHMEAIIAGTRGRPVLRPDIAAALVAAGHGSTSRRPSIASSAKASRHSSRARTPACLRRCTNRRPPARSTRGPPRRASRRPSMVHRREPAGDRPRCTEEQIDRIRDGGGTAISGGWARGSLSWKRPSVPTGSAACSSSPTARPSTTRRQKRLGKKAGDEGVVVNALGLGDDWNEDLLDGIAGASGGVADFIDSPGSRIERFFDQVVQSMQDTSSRTSASSSTRDPVRPHGGSKRGVSLQCSRVVWPRGLTTRS